MELCNLQENHLPVTSFAREPIRLSLVMPVYNFGASLKANVDQVMQQLHGQEFSFELILVNDGSKDNTREEMLKLANTYSEIVIIDYSQNRGKGYAVKLGVTKAVGELVFFTDIDLPYGLEPIFKGMQLLEDKNNNIILGSRDLQESEDILAYELKRKITKKVFSFIVNAVLRLGITDTQCGLKGFRKHVVQEIFPRLTRTDFSFDVEVLYLARAKNYQFTLVPVHLRHSANTSTVSVVRDSVKMLVSLMVIVFNIITRKYQSEISTQEELEC